MLEMTTRYERRKSADAIEAEFFVLIPTHIDFRVAEKIDLRFDIHIIFCDV